ncbi:hypothetical protein ACFOET_12795 [Parapedobacter deserti]|uniref:Uncharacterized protein n=1 Tax=Parapedobacter deserti TaxID=1912957 RepID=A0ABV7JK85_9SPHI
MTFEEFFIKKKIDLARMKRAKPDLYEEFREHFALMGEKSFDHTKKYWFNRLRKDFLLETAEIPSPKPAATPATGPVEDPVAPATEAAKPTGFKPRFKATAAKSPPDPAATEEKSSEGTKNTSPIGFKPRFKAGATTSSKHAQPPSQAKILEQPAGTEEAPSPQTAPKPFGFKPRFRAAKPPDKSDDAP